MKIVEVLSIFKFLQRFVLLHFSFFVFRFKNICTSNGNKQLNLDRVNLNLLKLDRVNLDSKIKVMLTKTKIFNDEEYHPSNKLSDNSLLVLLLFLIKHIHKQLWKFCLYKYKRYKQSFQITCFFVTVAMATWYVAFLI